MAREHSTCGYVEIVAFRDRPFALAGGVLVESRPALNTREVRGGGAGGAGGVAGGAFGIVFDEGVGRAAGLAAAVELDQETCLALATFQGRRA